MKYQVDSEEEEYAVNDEKAGRIFIYFISYLSLQTYYPKASRKL